MFSLRRQWHRARLAHELLLAHEREERERIPWLEIMRRMEIAGKAFNDTRTCSKEEWSAAVRKSAEQYPSDA